MPILGSFAAGSTRGLGSLSSIKVPTPEYWWRADSGLSTTAWEPVTGGITLTPTVSPATLFGFENTRGVYFDGTQRFQSPAFSSTVEVKHMFIRYEPLGFAQYGGFIPVFGIDFTTGLWQIRNELIYFVNKQKSANTVSNISPNYVWMDFASGVQAPIERSNAYSEILQTSGTWTKPAGVTEVVVECWGGGGAGSTVRTGSGAAQGQGGGGGQYARKIITYNSAQENISYTIGAGGIGSSAVDGNGLGIGENGGDTIWGSNVVVAKGGTGGHTLTSVGLGNQAGSIGDVIYFGGDGLTGAGISAGGGGGGGAGSKENGKNATATSTQIIGGNLNPSNPGGFIMGGPGASGPDISLGTISGNSAKDSLAGSGWTTYYFGGGGSGANRTSGTSLPAGGSGADGGIRVSYKLPSYSSEGPYPWVPAGGGFTQKYTYSSGQILSLGTGLASNPGLGFYGYIKEIAFFTSSISLAQGSAFAKDMMKRWPSIEPF